MDKAGLIVLLALALVPFGAQAEDGANELSGQLPAAEEKGAGEPGQEKLKKWFAEAMWRKFVQERDPRLADTEISRAELEDFSLESERSGAAIELKLDQITALLREIKGSDCAREEAPENGAWGLDLGKGIQ